MITIRSVSLGDAAGIADIYRPIVEKTTISFELEAPDSIDMRSRIEQVTGRHPWLVATENDAVLGYAYGSQHRHRAAYETSVDVSVYVDAPARGKGIASTLYDALFRELVALGSFHRAFARIALPNDASIGLHKKHGFNLVGVYHEVGNKFGRWIDVASFERSLP
jgi:L-amino acid N-acyltransferase YncA